MSKIILMNINLHEDAEQGTYNVEAKPANKWVRVGGPFNTRDQAIKFARNYSIENQVKTRVVTMQ